MEKDPIALASKAEADRQQIFKLINPFWDEKYGDLHLLLKQIQETGFLEEISDAQIERFENKAQQLSTRLDPEKQAHSLLILQQLLYKNSGNSDYEIESLKMLMECMFFFRQLDDSDDIRHFYRRYQQYMPILAEEDEAIHLTHTMLEHLSEILIILAMSDGLVQEEKDFIIKLISKEWEGNTREVGPFLNDIFQAVEMRESRKHDLVERFRKVTEMLSRMCNERQKNKIMEVIQGLIDADSKISVQEKMLYKIVKASMLGE